MATIALLGATGRMGTRVVRLLGDDARFELVAALTGADDPRLGDTLEVRGRRIAVTESTDAAFEVLIDFSVPAGTMQWLDRCASRGTVMVIGPTGYTPEETDRIRAASGAIAILHASNFSRGANLVLALVADIARRLGAGYDIEIIEHHHGGKVDAPSGTALSLVDAIVAQTGADPRRDVVFGRHGQTGVRPTGQIGVHAVRMGDQVGHHEVHFAGPGETVSIQHTAHSRDTFARGALDAAHWLCGRPPGMYTMADVLAAS